MTKAKPKKKKYVWQAYSYDVDGCSLGSLFSTERKAREYIFNLIKKEHQYRKEAIRLDKNLGFKPPKNDFTRKKYIEINRNEWTDEPKGCRSGSTYIVSKAEVK